MDYFDEYSTTLTSPYTAAMDITPDDSTDCPVIGRALNVIGDSHAPYSVRVTLMNDVIVTLQLMAGELHKLRVKRLHLTGTTTHVSFVTLW